MPIIDFTQPFYLISALVLFLLCLYLARNNKSNTVTCIMLLCFVTLLVAHTIELANAPFIAEIIKKIAICILFDEVFTFISFLSFLWLDKIEIENRKSKKTKKKNGKQRLGDKVIEDGLDILWKKV